MELGPDLPHEELFRETVAAILRSEGLQIWLAILNGEVAGTFSIAIIPTHGARCRPLAVVEDVIVSPPAQRQGVGRAMMQQAMELARASGCYKLMLSSSFRHEEAHRFYDRLGFQRHGFSFTVELKS